MPTERFYKLDEEKKKRIREAAADEFARVPYAEVSINQIVKKAGISRGSFYTYFDGTLDLASYMLKDFGEGVHDFCISKIKEHNGDFFSMLRDFYSFYSSMDFDEKVMDFYKNIFSDMNMIDTWDMHDNQCLFDKDKVEDFAKELYENIDHELIKLNYEEFRACSEMCFAILVKALVEEKLNKRTKQEIRDKLSVQYKIIYKGVTA